MLCSALSTSALPSAPPNLEPLSTSRKDRQPPTPPPFLPTPCRLRPAQKGEAIEADFEDNLQRITTACKVLYGAPVLLLDEVTKPLDAWVSSSPAQQLVLQRQMHQVGRREGAGAGAEGGREGRR